MSQSFVGTTTNNTASPTIPSFLSVLRTQSVSCPRTTWAWALAGLLLWSAPLSLYSLSLHESSGSEAHVWTSVVALHVVTGLLVLVEAIVTQGRFWPLQTLVIGGATFVTFCLASLLGARLASGRSLGLSLAALATACVANAVMVSILFELFHRQRDAPPPPPPCRCPPPARVIRVRSA